MEQLIRKSTLWLGVLGLLLAASGCTEQGVDPPTDRFFYPVTLAADPQGNFLLVANGNFNLTYTSGTVVPIDLRPIAQALDAKKLRTDGDFDGAVVRLPSAALLPDKTVRIGAFAGRMRIDPTGRVAYVTTREDSTIYALAIERDASGFARLNCGGRDEPLQECDARHRLLGYAPDDPTTLLREPFGFDFIAQQHGVGLDGQPGAACQQKADCAPALTCQDQHCTLVDCQDETGCQAGEVCSGGHCARGPCSKDEDCAADEMCRSNGCVSRPIPMGLLAAYLRTGDLVHFQLDPNTSLPLADGAQQGSYDLKFSSRDVAIHPDGRQAFVTSRVTEAMRSIRLPVCDGDCRCGDGRCTPDEDNATCPLDCPKCGDHRCDGRLGETVDNCPQDCTGTLSCGNGVCDTEEDKDSCPQDCAECGDGLCDIRKGENRVQCPADCDWKDLGSVDTGVPALMSGTDTRSVAISEDGERVFAARQNFPSESTAPSTSDVVVMSRTLSPNGTIRMDIIGDIPLQSRPTSLAFWPGTRGRTESEAGYRPDLLFALCYDSGSLVVIDATHMVLLDSLVVGRDPYEIAIVPVDDDPAAPLDGGRGLAFVSHFEDNEISVININPRSKNWLKLIGSLRGVGQ